MNNQFDDPKNLAEAWKFFVTAKWIAKVILGVIVLSIALFVTCNTASGQERAVLISSEKIKFSTYYKVVVSDSCNVYETKWNSHNWRGKNSEIPKTWDIVKTSKGKYFIKPVL